MSKKAAHHGGAWKVAYADFVTAMMALFMVLWISSQDHKILATTSRYFQHPFASSMEGHNGIMSMKNDSTDSGGSGSPGNEKGGGAGQDKVNTTSKASAGRQIELNFLNSVATDFKRLLRIDEDTQQHPIDVQVTSDGLRLLLFDRARQPLFVGDTTDFSPWGRFVMQSMAWLIERHKFRVVIEGHTRTGYKPAADNYTGWELSADRANAARRALVLYAVDEAAIERVSGYSDTRPVDPDHPEAEANERITISLSLGHQHGPSDGEDRPPAPATTAAPATASAPAASSPATAAGDASAQAGTAGATNAAPAAADSAHPAPVPDEDTGHSLLQSMQSADPSSSP